MLRTIFHAMNLYIKSSGVCIPVCWVVVHVHMCECTCTLIEPESCVLSGHFCTGSVAEAGT